MKYINIQWLATLALCVTQLNAVTFPHTLNHATKDFERCSAALEFNYPDDALSCFAVEDYDAVLILLQGEPAGSAEEQLSRNDRFHLGKMAIDCAHMPIFEQLMHNNAYVDGDNRLTHADINLLLAVAVRSNQPNFIYPLVKKYGADITTCIRPLMAANKYSAHEAAKVLVELGANIQDTYERSPELPECTLRDHCLFADNCDKVMDAFWEEQGVPFHCSDTHPWVRAILRKVKPQFWKPAP